MKIIDLLNKIANGEEVPKKVKYAGVIFENKDGDLLNDINCSLFEHRGNECEKLLPTLNDEVEILEEEKKIPEKLYLSDYEDTTGKFDYDVLLTINEIIDYLKSKGDE